MLGLPNRALADVDALEADGDSDDEHEQCHDSGTHGGEIDRRENFIHCNTPSTKCPDPRGGGCSQLATSGGWP